MAIQNPVYFGLPSEYVETRLKIKLQRLGLIKIDLQSFDDCDIEEIMMMREYLNAESLAKNKGR